MALRNAGTPGLGLVSLNLLWSKMTAWMGIKVQAADTSISSTFEVSWPLCGLPHHTLTVTETPYRNIHLLIFFHPKRLQQRPFPVVLLECFEKEGRGRTSWSTFSFHSDRWRFIGQKISGKEKVNPNIICLLEDLNCKEKSNYTHTVVVYKVSHFLTVIIFHGGSWVSDYYECGFFPLMTN